MTGASDAAAHAAIKKSDEKVLSVSVKGATRLEAELVDPVAIGGLGGSGTRLVAEILREVGVYLGADLNGASDNLWFTCLVSLPRWELDPPEQVDQPVYRALRVFERAMTGQRLDRQERKVVKEAVSRIETRWKRNQRRPPEWFHKYVHNLDRSLAHSQNGFPPGTARWGWKEPRTHFFLEYSCAHFGARLQYVHVIRNGLYMARSRNQNQFRSLGALYGIDEEATGANVGGSLEFWITANQLAISRGRQMPADTFYLLNYDDFCAHPQQGVEQLLKFLHIEPPQSVMATLTGRAEKREATFSATELASFTSAQLDSVRALGFNIEESP